MTLMKKLRALFGAQDMTVGSPMSCLLKFSVPLLIGNLAQQMYSTVDAIIIGQSISLNIKPNFVVSLIGVIGGSVIYYLVYTFVIWLGLDTDLLKMLSAVVVAVFLALPYLKAEYFTKPKMPEELKGGDRDA